MTMNGVAANVLCLVGNTPMVRLQRIVGTGEAEILCKMESLNPGGSVKDRIALAMIREAEVQGILHPGVAIVAATSGNSGDSLAMVAAAKGYHLVIFMPENAIAERRRLLSRYGVEVKLSPAYLGMEGSHQEAKAFLDSNAGCIILDLFRDPSVVDIHRDTTGLEILQATQGKVDAFVSGVGTGGTITGVGGRLKEVNPSVLIVAVEPSSSQVLTKGEAGPHAIPGIGADFIPPLLVRELIDDIVPVSDGEASEMTLRLAREEGLLVGVSSGANIVASLRIAQRLGEGKTVVTVLPDAGSRYLSFPM